MLSEVNIVIWQSPLPPHISFHDRLMKYHRGVTRNIFAYFRWIMVQEFSLRSSSELGGMERRLDDYRESPLATSSIKHKSEKGALRDVIPVSENRTTAENCARACTAGSGAAPYYLYI